MKLNVPNKIFDRKINEIDVGLSEIYLYDKDEIEEAQAGYRYNGLTGEVIEDWIGDEYIVIGNDSCCGDPIIVKVDEEELPIYNMFHDDWDSLQKISNSFEEFLDVLKLIDNIDLRDRESCKRLLENIRKKVKLESYDYWDSLITTAFEFLTDENYDE